MNFATHTLSVGTQHSTIQFATNVTAYVTNMPCLIKLFGWAVTFYTSPAGARHILSKNPTNVVLFMLLPYTLFPSH